MMLHYLNKSSAKGSAYIGGVFCLAENIYLKLIGKFDMMYTYL